MNKINFIIVTFRRHNLIPYRVIRGKEPLNIIVLYGG